MFGNMISNMMVKPGQSPLFDNPEAHGLDYENVEFKAEDGVTLRGWLINGGTDKIIVQTHFGVQCNRGGWTPKGHGPITPWKQDIQFLRQAKYLMDRGVLRIDVRYAGARRKRSWVHPLGKLGTRGSEGCDRRSGLCDWTLPGCFHRAFEYLHGRRFNHLCLWS